MCEWAVPFQHRFFFRGSAWDVSSRGLSQSKRPFAKGVRKPRGREDLGGTLESECKWSRSEFDLAGP